MFRSCFFWNGKGSHPCRGNTNTARMGAHLVVLLRLGLWRCRRSGWRNRSCSRSRWRWRLWRCRWCRSCIRSCRRSSRSSRRRRLRTWSRWRSRHRRMRRASGHRTHSRHHTRMAGRHHHVGHVHQLHIKDQVRLFRNSRMRGVRTWPPLRAISQLPGD